MKDRINVVAGIVLFNPNIERLKENVSAISNQVSHIVMVNNGSSNYNEILSSFSENGKISFIDNKDNKGIAFALKAIMDYASDNDFDWALTLDQDSVCESELMEAYSSFICENTDIVESVGILTCNIVDRNFVIESGFAKDEKWKIISQAITSASLIRVKSYLNTDGFDSSLFIDSVDFDICINMRIHGYKIIRINYNGILHEVGNGFNVKLFGKTYATYNHSPFRQYYIARNHLYLAYKYPSEVKLTKEILKEIRFQLLILLYEDNKMEKLKARWRGIRDVKKMRG